MKHLAILSTHPIQYNAPLFRLIAAGPDINLKVFYSKVTDEVRFDKDFGHEVTWDIPLTEGYDHASFEASTGAGLAEMIAAMEGFLPNVVLVFGWNFHGHFAVMKHFKGRVPVWFRGDSTLLDPLPFWKRWARWAWLNYVYRHIDRAFYVGQANLRYFRWCGLQEYQLVYAPHAVDNEFFMDNDEERTAAALKIRKEQSISETAVVFLFVGKLEAKKQPLELAQAFLEMVQENPEMDSHLVVIGSGALEGELIAKSLESQRIHLVGFKNQSDMPIWYRVGDVLCLPSRGPGETWGLAVNEAMACGCSAIVSDRVGCGEDLAKPGIENHMVPFDNVLSWKTAMKSTFASPVNRQKPIAVIGNFTIEKFVVAIKQLLHDV